MHGQFKLLFGLAADEAFEHIAYYKLTRKMHKDPIGSRFISSSENRSVQPISVWLSRLLKVVQSEVSVLFGDALQSMGISERWTARSWVITDMSNFIPLVHVWNSQYAAQSPDPPVLSAKDCERLYTKIPLQDMRSKVLHIVSCVFNLPEHIRLGHVAVKVRENKHAQWLQAHEVPISYHDRSSSGDGGDFVIFDLRMIDIWITFLLDNMFIMFGNEFRRQAIGAPMGTNCAGDLVNLYLSAYELAFVQQLSRFYNAPSSPPELVLLALLIQRAFLLISRYLDDIASINNPYFDRLLYTSQTFSHTPILGIYPPELNIKSAGSGLSIHYMSVTVCPSPRRVHRLTTVHFDKRFVPPMSHFDIVRFPHMSSNIAEDVKYNIVVGRLHAFRRCILSLHSFVSAMADVVLALAAKGAMSRVCFRTSGAVACIIQNFLAYFLLLYILRSVPLFTVGCDVFFGCSCLATGLHPFLQY